MASLSQGRAPARRPRPSLPRTPRPPGADCDRAPALREMAVRLAQVGGRLVVGRQEGVAGAAPDRSRLVEQPAGEDDRAAGRRAIGPWPIFGEAEIAALIVAGVEVEGDGEAAMGGAEGGIVAMGAEMAAGLGVVAADQVTLHPGRLELEDAPHHRASRSVEAIRISCSALVLDPMQSRPHLWAGSVTTRLAADIAHIADSRPPCVR